MPTESVPTTRAGGSLVRRLLEIVAIQISRKMPIRMALVAPFLLIITCTAGLSGYLTLRNGTLTVRVLATRLINEIGARTQERLLSLIELPHRLNEVHANAFALKQLDPDDVRGQERHFWRHLRRSGPISHSFFGNAEGDFVGARLLDDGSVGTMLGDASTDNNRSYHYFTTDSRGRRTGLMLARPKTDVRKRPWFTRAIKAKGATWSQIYTAIDDGSLGITACLPIVDENGVLRGVLGASFDIVWINEFLNTLEIGKTGELFIVERSGLLVSSSAPTSNTIRRDGKIKRIRATESQNMFIQQTAKFIENRFGGFRSVKRSEKMEFDIDDDRHFLHIIPLLDRHGLDWVMVIALPENDFMDQIRANNRSVYIILAAALILATAIGILVVRWILGPINRLNRSAQALAQGDLKQAPDVQRQDELGQLARTFNSMAVNTQALLLNLRGNVSELNKEVEQRKKAEEELREATLRRDEVIKAANVGLWDWDLVTDKVQYSAEWKQQIGYGEHEIHDDFEEWRSRVHPDDVEAVLEKTRKCIAEAWQNYRARFRFLHKDGSYRWILAQASVTKDETGRPILMRGSHVDITDLKRSEQKLQESESRFRTIFEQAAVGVALIESKTGRFLRINKRYCEMVGYTIEEMSAGLTFQEITHPGDLQLDLDNMAKLLAGDIREFTMEKRYYHSNGSIVWVNLTVSPTWEAGEEPKYHIAVVEDITERKKVEQRIANSLKEKEVMLQEIHHRVKNNLQMVESLLNLQLSEIQDSNLSSIISDGKNRIHSIALVHETIYRSNDLSSIDTKQYIKSLVSHLLKSIKPTHMEINVIYKIESVPLDIDSMISCGLIINELVNNAIKYAFVSRKSGSIEIELQTATGSQAKLMIKDDGVGMKAVEINTAQSSLGLKIIKILAEQQLEGNVTIVNDQGTAFLIRFPIKQGEIDGNEE